MCISNEVLEKYFNVMINNFFKILPLKESNEPSLREYMKSLQIELSGYHSCFYENDKSYMIVSLISILQYLIENDCDTSVVKREVFKAIDICKKLKKAYHEVI